MSKKNKKNSEFAEILRRLLDDTGIFNRKEWSEFLGISTSAISQWLHDETMPRPELLRMIVGLVKGSSDVPRDVLIDFESMASKPADEVLPPGRKMDGSINSYLVSPLMNGFLCDLKRLRPTDQEKVLLRASEECSIMAGIIRPPASRPTASMHPGLLATPSEAINHGVSASIAGPNSVGNSAWLQSGLVYSPPASALDAAELVIESLGDKADILFDQITKYLNGAVDPSLRREARIFCLHALAHVRTQNNNAPMLVMQHIIRSMDTSSFTNLQRMTEALTVLFLTDDDTAILVKQDGEYVTLEQTNDHFGAEIETYVRTITPLDPQYIHADRISNLYKRVKIESGDLVRA